VRESWDVNRTDSDSRQSEARWVGGWGGEAILREWLKRLLLLPLQAEKDSSAVIWRLGRLLRCSTAGL